MTSERDEISDVVAILKREGERPQETAFWGKVDHDLRSFHAELNLARSEEHASKDKSRPRDLVGTASIIEARELMLKVRETHSAAKALPQLLSQFAAGTYGSAGLASLPSESIESFYTALDELADYIEKHEEALVEAVAKIGGTKGSKGPLLQRLHGSPTVRFLQRFIAMWHDATGRETLGEKFETAAKQLLDMGLPYGADGRPRETGILKRQIETARRLGPIVETESTRITEIMNKVPRRHTKP